MNLVNKDIRFHRHRADMRFRNKAPIFQASLFLQEDLTRKALYCSD
jgi:hypothetical protein